MDPIICCLLGLCCPPAQRLERVTVGFTSWGCPREYAAIIAQKLIAAFDDSPLGHFLKWAVKHAGEK